MTLKQMRVSRGLTRKYVAEKLGIKLRTLISYEQGTRNVPHEVAERIAAFFQIPLTDVWGMLYSPTENASRTG